jgi:hypothetical protein
LFANRVGNKISAQNCLPTALGTNSVHRIVCQQRWEQNQRTELLANSVGNKISAQNSLTTVLGTKSAHRIVCQQRWEQNQRTELFANSVGNKIIARNCLPTVLGTKSSHGIVCQFLSIYDTKHLLQGFSTLLNHQFLQKPTCIFLIYLKSYKM